MEIGTERLLLRHARPDDLGSMHAILSDPRAMRYWSTLPHTEIETTAAWFQHMLDPVAARHYFIIEHEGRVIGRIGMWQPPEIGFILHPDAWGRGLGTEALRAFIGYIFAIEPLPALTADVDPRNLASLRVLARVGFEVTGRAERTFLLGDQWCDSLYLTLARPT